jgi:hypothetical protein
MSEAITRILVEDILVFAYCAEDQITDDFSVSQLERIASALCLADEETRCAFLQVVSEMAKEAAHSGDAGRARQLNSMPEHLGLVQ